MNLRFCLPRVTGRGGGLGNEMVPWARAYVASQVLGARLLPPAFGFNRRPYWRHFETSRLDWLAHRVLEHTLPRFEFDERAFLDFGDEGLADAVRRHARRHDLAGRGAYVWVTDGLWGGYHHLMEAREFARETLRTSRFAARNLDVLRHRLDPARKTVAMHVRLGDFGAPVAAGEWRGRFNVSLPLDWYVGVATSLRAMLGDAIQFLVVSDGSTDALAPLVDVCGAITTGDIADSDASDLLALAQADLLVCSVSSYSAWAAFLSDAPYLWFEPNLQRIDGFYSIWGHEPEGRHSQRAMRQARERHDRGLVVASPRGVPIGPGGTVPVVVAERLMAAPVSADAANDLVVYGLVPHPA